MRGTVLAYDRDSDAGLIRGEDGNRYGFRAQEWRERSMPIKGVHVDFEPDGPMARDLYIIMPTDSTGDGEPVSFLIATRSWISNHPEALVACLILIACGLPFYRFLGIETTLYQAPEILLRLSSGLERIRALAQQTPSAATAAAVIKMMLPGIYILWLIPLLAIYVLYRALFDLPRLGLLRLFGFSSILLPVLVPLMVVVPTWFLVVQAIPAEQQITLSHSVFDLPRFGPLREIALGAVATMILGLGLFLWSINPDNVDDRAAARQGVTHRHGRPRQRQNTQGASAGPNPGPFPAAGASARPGAPEAFAPPRLRGRPGPNPGTAQNAVPNSGGPPMNGPYPVPAPPYAQAQNGSPTMPAPGPGHPPPQAGHPPAVGQPAPVNPGPHPGQINSAIPPGQMPPLQGAPASNDMAFGAPPPYGNGAAGGGHPHPSFDDGAPHHDPIPESLRRRFEERQQRMGQQSGTQSGQTPPATQQGKNGPAQLPPPAAFDDRPIPMSGQVPDMAPAVPVAPQAQPGQPQLPDVRDGQGVPADASVSGWSVDPGAPRYDFEGMQQPESGAVLAGSTDGAEEEPYAALARQLRLTPGGAAGPQDQAPGQIQTPPAANGIGPPSPAPPPKTLEALAATANQKFHRTPDSGSTRGREGGPVAPSPTQQPSKLAADILTPPRGIKAPAPPADDAARPQASPSEVPSGEAASASPDKTVKKAPLPPPPKEITDFLRLLDEPDGLRKLAASAPPVSGFPPSAQPAGKPDVKTGSPTDSATAKAPAAKPRQIEVKQPDKPGEKPARGNGVAPPPPPPPPDSALEQALGRAMERLNGGPDTAAEKSSKKSDDTDPKAGQSSSQAASDTVTALYERLRQERGAKEPKSDLPIPPVPPRR
jgi:hypothetical protein